MNKKIAMFALTGCIAMTLAAGHSHAAGNTTRDLDTTNYGNGTITTNNGLFNNGRDGDNRFGMNSAFNNNNNGTYRAMANDDDGFDWGWLGLLGLLGLAGMRSKSRERDHA